MRNIERSGYYERLYETCKREKDQAYAEIKRLSKINEGLNLALREKELAEKTFISQMEELRQQYSEGILDLAEAKAAYQSATKDIVDLKKHYMSVFKRQISRIKK